MCCAAESTSPGTLESVGEVVTRTTRVPVANLGLVDTAGLGIQIIPSRLPLVSEIKRLGLTTERAPEVEPTRISPSNGLP